MEEDDGEDDLGGSSLEQSNLGNWFFEGCHTYRLVKSVLLSISNLGLHQICCSVLTHPQWICPITIIRRKIDSAAQPMPVPGIPATVRRFL